MRIDAALGAAIVRDRDGVLHALRAGEASPDGRFRVERIFSDRVEIQAGSTGRQGARYWMKAGADGGEAVLIAVSRQPPPSAPLPADAPRALATFGARR